MSVGDALSTISKWNKVFGLVYFISWHCYILNSKVAGLKSGPFPEFRN